LDINNFKMNCKYADNVENDKIICETSVDDFPLMIASRENSTVTSRPILEVSYYNIPGSPLVNSIKGDITVLGGISASITGSVDVDSNQVNSYITGEVIVPKFSVDIPAISGEVTVIKTFLNEITGNLTINTEPITPVVINGDLTVLSPVSANIAGNLTITPDPISAEIAGSVEIPTTLTPVEIAGTLTVVADPITPVTISGDVTVDALSTTEITGIVDVAVPITPVPQITGNLTITPDPISSSRRRSAKSSPRT
jgi:hypothetical protein